MSSRSVAALAAILLLFSISAPIAAQSSNWVTSVSVRDLTGNATLQAGQPLLAGHAYNMTLEVSVPFNQTNSRFQVSLDGFMLSQGPQFWYLKSQSYGGYDPNNFTAGMHTVSFKQVKGTLRLSAVFLVPINMTVQKSGSLTLHFPLESYNVVRVTVPGSQVGGVAMTVEDETIRTYLTTYQAKSTLVSGGQVDQAYSQFVAGVLNMSKVLYAMGLADTATSLLNIVSPASFPAPPNPTLFFALAAAVAVLVLVAVVLAIMMLRSRGRSQYALSVSDEARKELATLEVTASKYDKSLADRLRAIRDKLSEAS